MSEVSDEGGSEDKPVAASNIGRVEWIYLTVDDASRVKDFYCAVVGWSSTEVEMGSYSDFNINLPGTQDTIAGVCHNRGSNANLPRQLVNWVGGESVQVSASRCEKLGGKMLDGQRRMGGSNFCVIEEPAGAVMALMSD